MFDQDFTAGGTWTDEAVSPGSTDAHGGSGYNEEGFPAAGRGSGGWISFDPAKAASDAPYVQALNLDARTMTRPWLGEDFVRRGGELQFSLSTRPDRAWGSAPRDAPPSYGPRR